MLTLDNMEKLSSYGFEYLTEWELNGDRIKLRSMNWQDQAGWIYAFACEDQVRYLGITTNVLKMRMDSYRDQINDRVGTQIRDSLGTGMNVSIYGLRKPGLTKEQLEAEESKLIQHFGADWNVRR